MFSVLSSRLVLELSWILPFLTEAAFTVNHLCAQLRKLNPFCFCQRCSVDTIDQQGATALHVAAERGGVEVCWTLLQRTGCRMLHEKTHSGLTPLELCKQGKTFRWICRGIFIPGVKKKRNPDYCYTRFIFAPSPGILMQINLLLYCVLLFLQTSATHQTTESVH